MKFKLFGSIIDLSCLETPYLHAGLFLRCGCGNGFVPEHISSEPCFYPAMAEPAWCLTGLLWLGPVLTNIWSDPAG